MNSILKLVFVAVTAIFPIIASASIETLSLSCSSNLVVTTETGYHASCAGDFLLDSGVIEDDTAIVLRAAGLLTIGHQVLLKSPFITLDADSVAFFGTINLQAQSGEFHLPEVNSGAILTTGNYAYLAGTTVGSYQQLNGNISSQQGGTVVLSNTNGVIVPLSTDSITVNPTTITAVPEPSNLSMLAVGLLSISFVTRRKTKQY